MKIEQPVLLPTAHAARYLGVSVSLLEKWRFHRNEDAPKVVKFGRTVRYSVSDLEAWIENHRK